MMAGQNNPMTTYTKSPNGGLVGPKMRRAIESVNRHGAYSAKLPLAEAVGPHGSRDYGYQIIDRCISKGLLRIDPDHEIATPQGLGAVVLTERGDKYLAGLED